MSQPLFCWRTARRRMNPAANYKDPVEVAWHGRVTHFSGLDYSKLRAFAGQRAESACRIFRHIPFDERA